MEEGRADRTAILSAVMRASHLLLDGEPRIFSDPFALVLSGLADEDALARGLDKFVATLTAIRSPWRPGSRPWDSPRRWTSGRSKP